MNRLSRAEQSTVVKCLVDGNSIRATARVAYVARNTVHKLLVGLGATCSAYQDRTLRNLPCSRIQVNEIWAFHYCKQEQVTADIAERQIAVDWWTWAAIDADTKLAACWTIGKRDPETAYMFVADMASRLATRVQLTSDALAAYLGAVVRAFGEDVDYARLADVFGDDPEAKKRYSTEDCTACRKEPVIGDPDQKHIGTSFIERQNPTTGLGMRRFTGLTNALSKKIENQVAGISLHFMYYNFARVHQTLKTTPAVAAGLTDHVWDIEEITSLLNPK